MLDSLDQYRRDALNHALLSAAEEIELLKRAKKGDAAAITRLVENNQLMVMSAARRYYHAGMTGELELMDLVQAGNEGLMEAIQRFDVSYGVRFSTYAAWWVRWRVRSHGMQQGSTIQRSRREADHAYQVRKARAQLQIILGRLPTTSEIITHTGLNRRLVEQILNSMHQPLSLDRDRRHGLTIEEQVICPDDPAEQAESKIEADALRKALARLPARTAQILAWRYGIGVPEPLTYREIGARLGISRTRVMKIEEDGMQRLREIMPKGDE